jgi:hypothetical protein
MNNVLKEYAVLLLKNGFKVYVHEPKELIKWLYFEKNNNIGYVQKNYFGGLDFSSVHKPNTETGTGFQIHTEIINANINHALDCFVNYPFWCVSLREKKSVIKYKDINEFLNKKINLIHVKININDLNSINWRVLE